MSSIFQYEFKRVYVDKACDPLQVDLEYLLIGEFLFTVYLIDTRLYIMNSYHLVSEHFPNFKRTSGSFHKAFYDMS